MATKNYNLDDPQNVNSFLAMIGGSQVSSELEPEPIHSAACEPSEAAADGGIIPEEIVSTPNSPSQPISVSPARGTKAPPSTPSTDAVTSTRVFPSLEPIKEDGSDILRTIADSSNLNLHDSIYATKNYHGRQLTAAHAKYATAPARRAPVMSFSNSFAALDDDTAKKSPRKKSERVNLITKYQDDVIAKFVKERTLEDEKKAETMTEPFPALEDFDDDKGFNMTDPADKVTQSTADTPESIKTTASNPKLTFTAASEEAIGNDGREEDREHLQHFKSWGAPVLRTRPTARVRKIILSNLPPESDLTLVQSLVYGGAIERFNLTTGKTSAYVTFVNADACETFYNAHPNGIIFRNPKTRRDHVVYVDKGQDVDVISGVLQAYLDCQASRVVRATGADEDWGMRALYKLAESKNRKIETIVDTYRDQIRTIIFRFTNIADAVTFRRQLLRDADWEMCNIQFMDDPAEKATGVHLED